MSGTPAIVRHITLQDRRRTVIVVVSLGLAGLFEGFGIATALPILEALFAGPDTTQSALTTAITGGLEAIGLSASIPILLALLVLMFTLKGLVLFVAAVLVGTLVAQVLMELRLRLLRAVTQAEWQHILHYPSGFIANAVSTETHRSGMAYQEFVHLVANAMHVLAYLALVFLVSWQTGLAAIVVGILILVLLQGRVSASWHAGSDQVSILREILARLTDALPSLKPLKAMGREKYLLPRLEEQTMAYFQAQRREILSAELLRKSREPLVMLALAAGLWAVIVLTSLASTTIMLLAALFYRTVTSITNMQQRWMLVKIGDSSFQSLMEHISFVESSREQWAEQGSETPPFEKGLSLENLSFSYKDHEVLKGITAELRSGSFVTLVGPSGSGKTTLSDLVTGLLRPTGGRILVDGHDLSGMDVRAWRHRIGYVPQDPMLFSDTVRANITLGNKDLDDARVVAALRSASAWEFVQALPGGISARIGEGGLTLSGGQKQRLAIARALVVQPSLLLLDEPTTSLDSQSEAEVCEAIALLKGELTILAISHQAALRGLADEVWEIRGGLLRVVKVVDTERSHEPAGQVAR